jgi:hypothetical protein
MIVSTPNETYDQTAATAFLATFPADQRIREANALAEDKVFAKQHSSNQTSRYYAYTPTWLGWSDGPMPGELFSEATAMAEKLDKEEKVTWDGVCTGADIAALLEMTSEGTVSVVRGGADSRSNLTMMLRNFRRYDISGTATIRAGLVSLVLGHANIRRFRVRVQYRYQ